MNFTLSSKLSQVPAATVLRKGCLGGPNKACTRSLAEIHHRQQLLQLKKSCTQKSVKVAAAAADIDSEEDVDDLEDAASSTEEVSGAAESASTEGLDFALNFLWMEKNIAVAVDQVFAKDQRSPVTEYYFWPRKDAWEELKNALEVKAWISSRDKVLLLNRTTEVINFWQTDGDKPSLEAAQKAFTDCIFRGS